MNNFFRKLFSTTLISCLSLSMFACGSQSTGQVAVENAGTLSSDDMLLINEEVVPKSSTPAGEEDDTRNVQKLSNMGMTLPLPEEYVNTKGFIEYQDIDLSDEGLYFATASYIGIPKEKYDEMVSGGMSAEDTDYILTTPLKGARINVYEKRIDNLLENR
ncbi:hypothetical protein [Butyrivibrio sp. XPD2002]|uniref:hypothetical protein n=1 Tax=Butyrivibrio sp. XPD2002 TaxID=1280665 RepID=UPI00047A049D|nr:hypothetical protein [Butyrivibrio sp. XPD2002]